jgi:hypothetical protein
MFIKYIMNVVPINKCYGEFSPGYVYNNILFAQYYSQNTQAGTYCYFTHFRDEESKGLRG